MISIDTLYRRLPQYSQFLIVMVFLLFTYSGLAQNVFEVEGQVKVHEMPLGNSTLPIVVQLPDGTLGIRDANNGSTQTLSLILDSLLLSENGGYVIIDTSNVNEIQQISRAGLTVTLSDGGSYQDSVLTESIVDAMVANDNYLKEEMDGSATNELQDVDLFQIIDDQLKISLTSDVDSHTVDLSRYLDNTDTQLTREQVQDSIGFMMSDNIEDLIEVVYNDVDDRIDYAVQSDLSLYDNSNSKFIQIEKDSSTSNELITSLSLELDSLVVKEGNTNSFKVSLKKIKGGTKQGTGVNFSNIRSAHEGSIVGDARGEYSVDLQTNRNNSAQVAASLGSVISGGIGNQIVATGSGSTIGGGQWNSISSSNAVIPGGSNLIANSYGETVIGYSNEPAEVSNPSGIVPTDRLFTIGNGTDTENRSNALVVLKNGKTGIGTSMPDATLQVAGEFKYIDGNQGFGKVLVSDENGMATWQNLSISIVGLNESKENLNKSNLVEEIHDELAQQKKINQSLQAQLKDQQLQIDLLKSLIIKRDNASLD